jgi:hypothetical protein
MRGFVELERWLKANNEGLRAFALRSGIDKTSVWRLLEGKTRTCSLQLVDKITKATNGEVGAVEIRAYERRMARHRASVMSA